MSYSRWIAVLQRLIRGVERVVEIGVWINGGFLILLAMLIGVDVLSRKFFAFTLGGSDEIGGYLLAISASWAASFTLLKRSHIRIDIVYSHLGEKARYALDVVSLVGLSAFVGAILWFGQKVFMTSYVLGSRANTPLLTPLWVPQGLWLIGLAMFMVTSAVLILATITAQFGHSSEDLRRVTGISSAQDEVRDQLAELERRHVGPKARSAREL
jgi:TRAP-type mannitol/chloroaromatic compound transport system permease small subunit